MVPVAAVLVISQQGDGVSAVGGGRGDILGNREKRLFQRRKERKRFGGGVCGGWGGAGWGGTKELLWMEVYDVNPFLSSLHTNNKKPA